MRFAKWGDSLAAHLLKALAKNLGLKIDDEIQVAAKGPGDLLAGRDSRRQQVIERMRRRIWAPPDGYAFDRAEANAR